MTHFFSKHARQEFETIDLDNLLQSQTRKHRRVPLIFSAIFVSMLIAVLIWQPVFSQIQSLFIRNTTTIAVLSNISHATVKINGIARVTDLPATFSLQSSGANQKIDISVSSPPFMTQSCSVTVQTTPASRTFSSEYMPRCRFTFAHDNTLTPAEQKYAQGAAIVASVFFDDATLPLQQQQTIINAIANELSTTSQSITIPSGQQFIYNSGVLDSIKTMPDPVTATLAPSIVQPVPQPITCQVLCSTGIFNTLLTNQLPQTFLEWNVEAQLRFEWTYTDQTTQESLGNHLENLNEIDLLAHIIYNQSGWSFSIQNGVLPFSIARDTKPSFDTLSLQCYDARISFENLAGFLSLSKHLTSTFTVENHFPEGCLLEAFTVDPASGKQIPALYAWRFGKLFAINPNAEQIDPALPVTNSQDLQVFSGSPLLQQNTIYLNQ